MAVTFCPSANIGEATAGAVGAIPGATAEGGIVEGLVEVSAGVLGAGTGSDAEGGAVGAAVIGAGEDGVVFGFVATADGSDGLSPVKGASQSASRSGSIAR